MKKQVYDYIEGKTIDVDGVCFIPCSYLLLSFTDGTFVAIASKWIGRIYAHSLMIVDHEIDILEVGDENLVRAKIATQEELDELRGEK